MKITGDRCRGFTITEIMVTLFIVTLITMVSTPIISQYITQAKIAHAINSATLIQTLVGDRISAKESVTGSGTGLSLPATLSEHVASFSVSSAGVISITTTANASSITFTLTPTFNATNQHISWICAVSNASFNSLVPSKCRI